MYICDVKCQISHILHLRLMFYIIFRSPTEKHLFHFLWFKGITDFSLRVALQTLLKEYTEVTKSPKENKMYSQLQPAKMRPRRKARKYLYAIGSVSDFLATSLKP